MFRSMKLSRFSERGEHFSVAVPLFDIFLIIINKISQNYSINSCIIKPYNYDGRKCR